MSDIDDVLCQRVDAAIRLAGAVELAEEQVTKEILLSVLGAMALHLGNVLVPPAPKPQATLTPIRGGLDGKAE
jgi:hypothetical protein